MIHRRAFSIALLVLSGGAAGLLGAESTPPIGPDSYKQLKFRYIGPVGNRVIAIAGVPGNPNIYYAGAASGGIFKTTDNGAHWDAIFDDQKVSSIGSLAVAPSDPNVVFAGTAESFIRSNISIGNGIYKSTDAGKTWTHAGLDKTGRIGRVLIDPTNPDIVIACALGHAYGPQPERGVFRTTDGGKNWERTLFVDEGTGCSDVAMDNTNPRILFAGMWQIEIHTWGRKSGGDNGGLFKSPTAALPGSADNNIIWATGTGFGSLGGTVERFDERTRQAREVEIWPEVTIGTPAADLKYRFNWTFPLALSPHDHNTVYAGSQHVHRTTNGGQSWQEISPDLTLNDKSQHRNRFW